MSLTFQIPGTDWSFLEPHWLWLLLLLPLFGMYLWRKEKSTSSFLWTSKTDKEIKELESTWVPNFRKLLLGLKLLVFVLLVAALAGPFTWKNNNRQEDFKTGIDIVLALDVSKTMYSRDFKPNRLEAAKTVAKEFVSKRSGDRIGLVVFAGEAYTACPSTVDYELLTQQIERVDDRFIDGGTAIGTGLGTAINRLQGDSLSTKVVILLTDGSNNSGELSPSDAADLAKAMNVRVYTIGMGSNVESQMPVITPFGIRLQTQKVEIDEETLQMIADKTGGSYFRAVDLKSLTDIYDKIDALEKKLFLNEIFEGQPPVNPGLFLSLAFGLLFALWLTEKLLFPNVE